MIITGTDLLALAPITDMLTTKEREHGVSHGLGEAGYDIRIKQEIVFWSAEEYAQQEVVIDGLSHPNESFVIASSIEHFQMPTNLVGFVKDKSTWARQGLSVFNTVIEPGWSGWLTLELKFNTNKYLKIPAGAGIAQVLFQEISVPTAYTGKYQNAPDMPTPALES